ncbi:MFS transporter [Jiella endophytica]|uniref:MFS transporter n=1 Tax=Jiella endophytica TaxID=2558362 RepID=A0A4Y8RNK5_9HYPH|nr:MFS transporter [Jiella endophytica]TFF25232.1 MFS transporter [Jiella endophytica]
MNASLAPALMGHAFQQTALMAMLPLIAGRLGLSDPAVATAVGLGMVAATLTIPLMGLTGSRRLVGPALVTMIVCSVGLALLLVVPLAAAPALGALLLLRLAQGMSAATVLVHAQTSSLADATRSRERLAATQSFAGLGRAASAVLVGPLVAIGVVLPMLPAIAGGVWSLATLRRSEPAPAGEASGLKPPRMPSLVLPFLVQTSLGITHVSLAPLLAVRLGGNSVAAATHAGFALAAANLGLLVSHRFLTSKVEGTGLRLAAFVGGGALVAIALWPQPAFVVISSGVVGGASAMLLTHNLHTALERSAARGTSQAAWNATVSTGGLAAGALVGSAALHLGANQAVALAGVLMASAVLAMSRTRKPAS